jgi:hypothetical protein
MSDLLAPTKVDPLDAEQAGVLEQAGPSSSAKSRAASLYPMAATSRCIATARG